MKHLRILFVATLLLTALNVSVFGQVPVSDNMPAVGVLGQSNFTTAPSTVAPTASVLNTPKGIAIDPTTGKLFVADYENRRVLRWSSTDKLVDGSAAEAVLGQPDFITNTSGTSSSKLSRPYGICVDASGRLWVADLTNNRVLRFDNASTIVSGSAANRVLGQADFATATANAGGISASTMWSPIGVCVDGSGRLWVAERDNKRVLRFDNASTKSNGDPADGVLGEPDFVTNAGGLSASLMTRAYGVSVDGNGCLWVGDRDNNRVLRFDNAAAKADGAAADGVLGQVDFVTAVAARTQPGMEGPRGVFADGTGKLFVSDEANNRILVYNNAAAKANGVNADNVLGQADFTTYVTPNPPTASSLNYAEFLCVDNVNKQLWIADEYNNRILRFGEGSSLPLPVELTSFTATVVRSSAHLTWRTATEVNCYGFQVERRALISGKPVVTSDLWEKIGFVLGCGTSTIPHAYSFADADVPSGRYAYRIKQIDHDNSFAYHGNAEVVIGLAPKELSLGNYPNPFNPTTTIEFTVPEDGRASLKIYNTIGQLVATAFEGQVQGGYIQKAIFNASKLASGVYFTRLEMNGKSLIKKIALMK